jgi:hypothetical protein
MEVNHGRFFSSLVVAIMGDWRIKENLAYG